MIQQIIFMTVFFLIHCSINYYIYIRGRQALSTPKYIKRIYNIIFFIFFFSCIFGVFIYRYIPNYYNFFLNMSSILYWIGGIWFGVMLYSTLIIITFDIIRLTGYIFKFNPSIIKSNYKRIKQVIFIASIVIIIITLTIGIINNRDIQVTELNLKISRKCSLKSLNIVMISDLHVCPITTKDWLKRIVQKINSRDPDLVIMAGDIVDSDIKPFEQMEMAHVLLDIKSKYGVYAVTGNHEFFGNLYETVDYISKYNIKFLRDEIIQIDDCINLIGREDLRSDMFLLKKRKTLKTLVSEIDNDYPIILIDHQPFNLDEAAKNGIVLQLSGHTHHGQIFPLNHITELIFEKSWGYLIKGNTHYYVTCGIGTWGPPARIGSVPEIVDVKLHFE